MRMYPILLVSVVSILIFAATSLAQVPPLINFQGRLSGPGGVPLDTVVDLTITVYADEMGSASLWNEFHPSVPIEGGMFSVILGEASPFPEDLFEGQVRFLGVQVGEDPGGLPPVPLVSTVYALKSNTAGFAGVAGLAESVMEGAIRTGQIADSGIELIDINPGDATLGQVIKFNGTTWAVGDDATGGTGAGWVDDDTRVYLANPDDSVGIGTDAPAAKLQVVGPILSGYGNAVSDSASCIGGGLFNTADSASVIGGGFGNTAGAPFGVVGGGVNNSVQQTTSTIGGGSNNIAGGTWTTVGGGDGNMALATFSTISGGALNEIAGQCGSIGGGYLNHITAGTNGMIAGGQNNLVTADYATVAGGGGASPADGNSAEGNFSAVGGGSGCRALGAYSTVGGGHQNQAAEMRSTISGGYGNTAIGGSSVVGGGQLNLAEGDQSVVSGGQENAARGWRSTVAGGHLDSAKGEASVVSGGLGNRADTIYSTVSGGYSNVVTGASGTIGGGSINLVEGPGGTVGGGSNNGVIERWGVIAGGILNRVLGEFSTVGGGMANLVWGDYGVISGGGGPGVADSNSVIGDWGTIGGGRRQDVLANYGTVTGGYDNMAGTVANDTAAFVGGGRNNEARAQFTSIAGGRSNVAAGLSSTVGGGKDNSSGDSPDDTATFIGGGFSNEALARYACVTGGRANIASGSFSAIGGGYKHSNQGLYSVIPGGEGDTVGFWSTHSMAFGKGVFVSDAYRVIFYNGTNSGRIGINRDDNDASIDHPLHVGTNSANGNGAHLTAGGTWQNGSSREFKEEFEDLDSEELLARISTLPVQRWQYRGTQEHHIGPVAEDFAGAFGTGVVDAGGQPDDRYLSPGDVAGVALAGVKELLMLVEELRTRNEALEQRIAELELRK